ncbi:alkene reductase [Saccharopolyspora gloriosae]|uniref:N-ethylmaleimide reductase n=1 Tax=Saccharopolyspora gloriosae TaxID=455344 RepID=A0A840NPU3_9PSEU|nr:alkene reductase [Saccharopolyspora gloriosae]MBB5071299.1 N-ethylmaleimide reductase [Saccharopolyspora gloriosae]
MPTAFDPLDLAGTRLRNRIAMAPMTRSRAAGNLPDESTTTYYRQRATAGLIITEGVQPSVRGQGYPSTPGLHSDSQVAAWRKVTDAVHAEGGVIFAQLMHAGRISHPSSLPDGRPPLGPSAVAAEGRIFTADGMRDLITPEELTEDGIAEVIAEFAAAARNAVDAGFDGVELHGANGYLLHQFLSDNANLRTDGWGGSVGGRIRLTVEVARAVAAAIGSRRVGLRISPGSGSNDIVEHAVAESYSALIDAINPLHLAYLHVLESPDRGLTLRLRDRFDGAFLLNPHTPGRQTGTADLPLVEQGVADALTFGSLFLANPDLPARLAAGGPFNTPDAATLYGGGDHGYTDYPPLAA